MCVSLALRLIAAFTAIAFSAYAQIEADKFAADLRAKYGPPLAREVFKVQLGEMVVDFAANGHVCRIRLPGVGPDEGQPGMRSAKAVDDFLLKLLPLSMRGLELRRMTMAMGGPSVSNIEYENVTIADAFQGELPTR